MRNPIEELSILFRKFPGIGERQAKRFAYFVVKSNSKYREDLVRSIKEAGLHTRICKESFQTFVIDNPDSTENLSPIEKDPSRDSATLLIIEKDADLEAMESSNLYKGKYFILGKLAGIAESKIDTESQNFKKLTDKIKNANTTGLKEIILALGTTSKSIHTEELLLEEIKNIAKENNVLVTRLGRGISLGSEIEYADKLTLSSAISRRETL